MQPDTINILVILRFMGYLLSFSSKGSVNYDPFAGTTTSFSQAVVLNFFDPTPDGGTNACVFTPTHLTEDLPAAGANTVAATPSTGSSGGSGGGSMGIGLLAGLFGLFLGLRRRIK